jgi:hypothetical protein
MDNDDKDEVPEKPPQKSSLKAGGQPDVSELAPPNVAGTSSCSGVSDAAGTSQHKSINSDAPTAHLISSAPGSPPSQLQEVTNLQPVPHAILQDPTVSIPGPANLPDNVPSVAQQEPEPRDASAVQQELEPQEPATESTRRRRSPRAVVCHIFKSMGCVCCVNAVHPGTVSPPEVRSTSSSPQVPIPTTEPQVDQSSTTQQSSFMVSSEQDYRQSSLQEQGDIGHPPSSSSAAAAPTASDPRPASSRHVSFGPVSVKIISPTPPSSEDENTSMGPGLSSDSDSSLCKEDE